MAKYTRNLIAYISESPADGATVGNYPITRTVDKHGHPVFFPLQATARVAQSVNVTTPAVVSVGTNSPNFDNIVSAQPIGGLVGMTVLPLAVNAAAVARNTPLFVRVNTAAVPVPQTVAALNFQVIILGFDTDV